MIVKNTQMKKTQYYKTKEQDLKKIFEFLKDYQIGLKIHSYLQDKGKDIDSLEENDCNQLIDILTDPSNIDSESYKKIPPSFDPIRPIASGKTRTFSETDIQLQSIFTEFQDRAEGIQDDNQLNELSIELNRRVRVFLFTCYLRRKS